MSEQPIQPIIKRKYNFRTIIKVKKFCEDIQPEVEIAIFVLLVVWYAQGLVH